MRNTDLDIEISKQHQRLYAFLLKKSRDECIAEEITQAALLRAFEKEHQFERGTNLFGWLCTIAFNILKDYYKKRNREPTILYEKEEDISIVDKLYINPNQEETLRIKEILNLSQYCGTNQYTKCRNENYLTPIKTAIQFALGKDQEEIAKENNIPLGTVKSRINRGRKQLEDV